MYPEIPTLSFISAAFTLLPLTWYYEARNIAAVAIGIWLSVTNLVYAIDALIWASDANIEASVWCDISTVIITGSRIAIPAACLSICIHLERLASFSATSTPQAKRRRIVFEYVMCLGLPVLYIAMHLVVQPRRFDVFYGFGCRPATYPTIATIFLAVLPPLSLATGVIICACIAWHHFLVHGVQFYGKRSTVSSLTRNLYLRLIGMALLEAMFSALLVIVVMRSVLSPGLAPMESMSRNLSVAQIWGLDVLTSSIWTVLEIEWSVTVVQSVVFFGLFACRMEVFRRVWELIRSFLRVLERPCLPPVMFGKGSLAQSSTSTSVRTLPMTEVDLSLVIESASMLMPDEHSTKLKLKSPSSKSLLSHPPLVEDSPEDIVITTLAPALIPLESPSRASAIASSHNSLESNFDPNELILSADAWPQTPTAIPVRHSFSVGYTLAQESWVQVHLEDAPFPRVKPAVHVRSYAGDVFGRLAGRGSMEKPQGISVTVVRESYQ